MQVAPCCCSSIAALAKVKHSMSAAIQALVHCAFGQYQHSCPLQLVPVVNFGHARTSRCGLHGGVWCTKWSYRSNTVLLLCSMCCIVSAILDADCRLQEQATKAKLASMQTQLDTLSSSHHSTEEAKHLLSSQLASAQAEVAALTASLSSLQQQTQHDKFDSAAEFEQRISKQEQEWRKATNNAVATALADQAARDEALRQCLRTELAAAAQQEREGLKRDSSAAMAQQEAAHQLQLATLQQQHSGALSKQAEQFGSRLAQHAQQAAAQSSDALAADAARLQQAHMAESSKQAEKAAEQLEVCKRK